MNKDQAPALRAALRQLILASGKPPQERIRRAAEPEGFLVTQSTFSETLKKDAFRLPYFDTVMAIVTGCREYVKEHNFSAYETLKAAGQFDKSHWSQLHAEASGKSVDDAWPRVRDIAPLNAGVKLSVTRARSDSPIALWLESRSPRVGVSAYVPRDHDPELRGRLEEAMTSEWGAVIVIGRSCTGKSRSVWEAARDLAPDWYFVNMRHPEEAERLRRSGPNEGGVLLWLDNLRAGTGIADAVNATLAMLRDHRRPYRAVAVASMWHSPAVSSTNQPTALADSFALKELGAYAGQPVVVEEPWSDAELDRGWDQARQDQLLATALQQCDDSPPQVLAGSRWAIELWQAPTQRETRSLLTAVIDLAKFGFGVDPRMPLTVELLRRVTPAYLERPTTSLSWFETALAEATRPLEESIWALRPPLPGEAETYTLFDPLLEFGRLVRYHEPLPGLVWDVFARVGLTRYPLEVMAKAADFRLLHPIAQDLAKAAAAAAVTPEALPPTRPSRRAARPEPEPEPVETPAAPVSVSLKNLTSSPTRDRADRLLEEDGYAELVELGIQSDDTYVRRRLSMLYARHGEINKMRELASFSNRGGRNLVEDLCGTGDLTEILRMVAAGARHARRAIDGWPIKDLEDRDREIILREGLHPDGKPIGAVFSGTRA